MKTIAIAIAGLLGLVAVSPLLRRAQEWRNPKGGNVGVNIGENKFNWGDDVPWDAIDHIKANCLDHGCDKQTFQSQTWVVDGVTTWSN